MGTKTAIKKELDIIAQILATSKEGITLQAIKDASGLAIETRSLQRRLDKLRDMGLVNFTGNTRATVYQLASEPPQAYNASRASSVNQMANIKLSDGGAEVKKLIERPITQRTPVGYQLDFLLSYRPNIDSYLSDEDKRRLAEIGTTNTTDAPAGTYAKSVLERLLIDLSWNSSRLEGNTYSLLDTQYLISQGKKADHKKAADAQMILNHKDAIEFIVEGGEEIGFNVYTIRNLHALLSDGLLPDPAASGRLRTFGVGIADAVFTPLGIPQLIEEMFTILLEKANAIKNPFEQAFFIMVHMPYLQPFDDVNKRVSRLAANISLNRYNLAPLAFVDVPQELYIRGLLGVYELNRIELLKDVFLWSYERSAMRYAAIKQSLGEPDHWRMQYRDDIRKAISQVIIHAMPQQEATETIDRYAQQIPANDRLKFIEVVDTELLSLHEGNFARFRIKPSEFKKWQLAWKRRKP